MAYAAHIIRHSKRLRTAPNLFRKEHAGLVGWFSDDVQRESSKIDGIWKIHLHGYVTAEDKKFSRVFPKSPIFSSHGFKKNVSKTTLKVGPQMSGSLSTRPPWYSVEEGFHLIQISNCPKFWEKKWAVMQIGLPPHQEIGMPSLSPTMTEGNIARWLKKEGEKVSVGEVLCEVETDKATVEMECMEEGYLAKIIKGDGSKEIKVGEVIAITVEDEEDIDKFKDFSPSKSGTGAGSAKDPSSPKPATPPTREVVQEPVGSPKPTTSRPNTGSSEDRIFASPLARKLAEDHHVSLASIKGTGPDGRIVKADIEDYLASRGKDVSAAVPSAKGAAVPALDYIDIPHTQIRKVTASRLLLSKQTIPHYYLTVDACVDKLMDLRSKLNLLQEASGGKKISVNDLVIKAAALALKKVPQCNSSWTDDYIRQYNNVNINVAVQTDNGLYVPVIRDADKKGLSRIAEEVKLLAQKAKDNSLRPEDYEGGTFTVSNLGGPFGIKQFCAIINPPQSGILAVGSAEKRVIPGLGPDEFKFASFMSATLSCDHRVIDGAIGAEWLRAFKGYVESPESMLL